MTRVVQTKEFNAYQFILGTVTANTAKLVVEAELPGISITRAYILKEGVDSGGFRVGGYLVLGIKHPICRGGDIKEDTFCIYSGDWIVENENTGYEIMSNADFQQRFTLQQY